jgi:hypothetical protein
MLFQPEEKQVGILTVAAKAHGRDQADAASRSITVLEQRRPPFLLPRSTRCLRCLNCSPPERLYSRRHPTGRR